MAACIDSSRTTEPSQLSQSPNRSQTDENHYKFVNFCRPTFPDHVSTIPINKNHTKTIHPRKIADFCFDEEEGVDALWLKMKEEARLDVEQEPILSNYYYSSILSQNSLESALANHLSIKLSNSSLPSSTLFDIFMAVLVEDQGIIKAVKEDLKAVKERDPACVSYVHCLLNFKGFLACQAHRVAHYLWSQGRKVLALLIQNRVSEVSAVDIHPGAKIGSGILLDHATGVVVGETAVVGNNVAILHNVTLGGTGKVSGDRHPKIGDGVLIGADTCILGNINIGDGAKIGAGSVVLREVPPRTTAVGNPARLVGGRANPIKLDKIPSFTMDHTSHIIEWSDYVI
ncbi:serine acetyltransferase 1, chloroplastic [Durio zibethinus]|uniref:serine O-acetyltransferase n=1 Tax=Durio zibethinus TaxID=66656 RepID=A0A6P5WLC3_DURZI|nr:serine acetyltransferase 1, chloroplastic [Durio zibethinus]